MTDSYFLPERKARICRRFGALFLAAAAYWAVGTVTGMVAPGLRVVCDVPAPCRANADPVVLLTEDEQAEVARDPALRRHADAQAARVGVRVGLALVGFAADAPVVVVLLAVGLALRRLGTRGDRVLMRAVAWLKLASRAAVIWTVVQILHRGFRSFLIWWGSDYLRFPIDLNHVPLPLLLSIGAYATAWALEAGLRAERDLADFV